MYSMDASDEKPSLRLKVTLISEDRVDIEFPAPYSRITVAEFFRRKGGGELPARTFDQELVGFSATLLFVDEKNLEERDEIFRRNEIQALLSETQAIELALEVCAKVKSTGIKLYPREGCYGIEESERIVRNVEGVIESGKVSKAEVLFVRALLSRGGIRFQPVAKEGDYPEGGRWHRDVDRLILLNGHVETRGDAYQYSGCIDLSDKVAFLGLRNA